MQEIIVYRNPLEASIWNGVMDGTFLPVLAGVKEKKANFIKMELEMYDQLFNK